jgi:hypothetical protein
VQPLAFGRDRTREQPTILERNRVRYMVRIDGKAGLVDVSKHRSVVAVDEIRQVGPYRGALPMNGVALATSGIVAVEDPAAAPPAAPRQLGKIAMPWWRNRQICLVPRV